MSVFNRILSRSSFVGPLSIIISSELLFIRSCMHKGQGYVVLSLACSFCVKINLFYYYYFNERYSIRLLSLKYSLSSCHSYSALIQARSSVIRSPGLHWSCSRSMEQIRKNTINIWLGDWKSIKLVLVVIFQRYPLKEFKINVLYLPLFL